MSNEVPPMELLAFVNQLPDSERARLYSQARRMAEHQTEGSGARIRLAHASMYVKRKTRVVTNTISRGVYKVGHTIHDIFNWILSHWRNYMMKHPHLHSFLSIVGAFAVGFIGFIVIYSAIISSVIVAAAFLPL